MEQMYLQLNNGSKTNSNSTETRKTKLQIRVAVRWYNKWKLINKISTKYVLEMVVHCRIFLSFYIFVIGSSPGTIFADSFYVCAVAFTSFQTRIPRRTKDTKEDLWNEPCVNSLSRSVLVFSPIAILPKRKKCEHSNNTM